MHLIDLPPEILSIILQYLDLRSKLRAWNSCFHLRRVLCRPEVARRANFARSRRLLPALQSSYFRQLALYIREVDLSWVNLHEVAVGEPLKSLRNLRSLNVSNTGMKLEEVSDVCEVLPLLTRLHADGPAEFLTESEEYLKQACAFRHLKFLQICTIVWSPVILETIGLVNELMLSCTYYTDGLVEDLQHFCLLARTPLVKVFSLHVDEDIRRRTIISRLIGQQALLSDWEFVVKVTLWSLPEVYLSPSLHDRASGLPGGEIYRLLTPNDPLLDEVSNFSLFAWHTSVLTLNPTLYEDVVLELHRKAPVRVCRQKPVVRLSDCYYLSSCTFSQAETESEATNCDAGKFDINLSAFVDNNKKFKVSYSKMCECPDALLRCDLIESHNVAMLKNITYFSVTSLALSRNFYEVLFKNCTSLETVLIKQNTSEMLHNVFLSESIKNVCIIDEIYNTAGSLAIPLTQLSRCRSLENVHLYDTSSIIFDAPSKFNVPLTQDVMLPFFKNCSNLCSLYVCMNEKIAVMVARAQYRVVKNVRNKLNRQDVYFQFEIHPLPQVDLVHNHEPRRSFFEQFTLWDFDVNKILKND